MNAEERKRLEALGFTSEVIERADAVLAAWGEDRLFATCVDCGGACLVPELPRRKNRKKLPADLFYRRALLSRRDPHDGVLCMVCDDIRFG